MDVFHCPCYGVAYLHGDVGHATGLWSNLMYQPGAHVVTPIRGSLEQEAENKRHMTGFWMAWKRLKMPHQLNPGKNLTCSLLRHIPVM